MSKRKATSQNVAPSGQVPCVQCAPTASTDKSVVQPRKKALLNRLSRIGGQVNGIAQMVEKDRYCVDILTQVSAVRSALDAVASQLLADHASGCVRKAILEDGGEEAITELLGIIKKMR
ncbi:DNA-binding transcriptional regulator, FrmR family [Pseudomonas flavescens]|uniref:DNA-binding transcriptional regulator, FrmR family n=1 Tax=Phytopseudomonas flavescens TaxID=29435 RepID=A0A1G8E8P9_9GAMM|nr:metal-sensitive transcriptional regulator [Pseudomonas flavescens]SDH66273.1 DNA-binding transcriptional regulator, FrmR family [Pseudomonas flavescens]